MTTLELLALTLFNALNYLTRYLLAAVKPAMSADLGFNHEEMGWLLAAWAFGYVAATPFFGLYGDRFRRPRLLGAMVLLWSVALLAFGLVRGFLLLALCRVLLGVAQSGFSTLVSGYLNDRINDPKRVTVALSVLVCAIPVGTALAYGLGAILASLTDWSTTFLIFAVPGLLFGWYLLRWPDPRATTKEVSVSLRTGTPIAFREPVLRYAIGGYILNSFGMNGIAGFIQDYGVERGFALEEIGGYFLGILLLGSVGTVLGGSLSARWERRSSRPPLQLLFAFLGITGMLAIPWLFGAFLVQDRFQFITLCGVGVFFVFVGTGPLNALLVRGSPPGFVNFVQGLTIVLLNFFGSFAAPPIIGAIAQRYSLQAGLLVCVVALLISTVIWILGVRWGKRAA